MRLLALLCLLPLFAAPAQAERFSFVAFGDMPYCIPSAPNLCPDEEGRVARLMGTINRAQPAFSIFLGDTKGGSEICSDDRLLRAFTWMSLAAHPLIYTPGDNEWTDCWQTRAGRFDANERLALLRARFFPDDQSLGRRPMRLTRQADTDPAMRLYVENARWERDGVVFVTAHVPGSNNNRPTVPGEAPVIAPPASAAAEYAARNAANIAWINAAFVRALESGAPAMVINLQADLFYRERCGRGYGSGYTDTIAAIGAGARAFGKPVLLLNGDSHFFLDDRPIPAAPNLRRIMVPGEQDIRAVLIAVDTEAAEPFTPSLIGEADRVAAPGCG
ncbi:hypothetical protein ACQW02_21465 [Humitalea sp. 24SJ18S-53]|uniref:hypothetical protein n=1 Tax=Humitalea sp. 24SJ18S-53 TaxID=3422307 RepID=UPI003D66BC1F